MDAHRDAYGDACRRKGGGGGYGDAYRDAHRMPIGMSMIRGRGDCCDVIRDVTENGEACL